MTCRCWARSANRGAPRPRRLTSRRRSAHLLALGAPSTGTPGRGSRRGSCPRAPESVQEEPTHFVGDLLGTTFERRERVVVIEGDHELGYEPRRALGVGWHDRPGRFRRTDLSKNKIGEGL